MKIGHSNRISKSFSGKQKTKCAPNCFYWFISLKLIKANLLTYTYFIWMPTYWRHCKEVHMYKVTEYIEKTHKKLNYDTLNMFS